MVDQSVLLIATAASVFVALWVFAREKLTIPALAFCAGMLVLAIELGAAAVLVKTPDSSLAMDVRWLALALGPAPWVAFAATYSRGQHRAHLRTWFPMIAALGLAPLALVIFLGHRLLDDTTSITRLAPAGRVLHVIIVLASTAVLMNLERTFRASVGVMRWQLKFMVLGVATLFVTRVYTSTQALVFSSVDARADIYHAVAAIVCSALAWVAVTRSQGFKLDLYPSATLIYRSLTIIGIGAYLVILGFMAHLTKLLGGGSGFAIEALLLLAALVALAVLLLSDRARIALKRFISRHLRRPTYDVQTVWRHFNEHTATKLSEAEFSRAACKWLADTFDLLSVTVWLVNATTNKVAFGASTSLSESDANSLANEIDAASLPLAALGTAERGLNIDANPSPDLEPLRRLHPAKFSTGGDRTFIPIIAQQEVLALIAIGDRAAGVQMTAEELDLIKCVAGQMASDIVRLRLSERLLQSKQIEAFQMMATFFVHDLKNTAWTLSLLVQNLRTHFDNPSFREEAVRSLGTSVARINDLISRIGSLRDEFRIQPGRVDLNALVSDVVKEFKTAGDVSVECSLGALPDTLLDGEQIQRVVKNLVLNAKEASSAGASIKVATEQQNGFAVLTVRDNGSGMSEEFLRTQLFRPFATTKKKGLGIGMYQTKMIVEAHNGRILVDSKPGAGTTFRILLPVKHG
jgi:putative PEP-CTERM system histidine kinase